MKVEQLILIPIILLCISGILGSIGNMIQSKHINQLEQRVNEIYFTQDYLEFVKAEGRI